MEKIIVEKVTKLSKVSYSIEHFTDGFSQFSNTTAKVCLLSGRVCTRNQLQAFQGFSEHFLIS